MITDWRDQDKINKDTSFPDFISVVYLDTPYAMD